MKTVIILCSSRSNGDTAKNASVLSKISNWDVIDLNNYNFSYYDYEFRNRMDDFIPLIKQIISQYNVLVFASPVYWYSMSGILKVFFDRITDLLDHEKLLGRKLRGKKMAVLSVSNGDNLGDYFWLPFIETSKYLGMDFITGLHTISGKDNTREIKEFFNYICSRNHRNI